MKEMVTDTLNNIGFASECIFSEDFELSVNETDLMNVVESEVEFHVTDKKV